MNWYDSPTTLQRLAAAYALGTLAGPARRRFERVLRTHPGAAQAVDAWHRRLAPLAEQVPPRPASAALWTRIEHTAFAPAPRSAKAPAAAPAPSWLQTLGRWLNGLLAPLPAAALVTGLAVGLVLPMLGPLLRDDGAQTELPESYVGVLATAEGRPGLIVSSLRHGRVVDLKRVAPVPLPPGRVSYLWIIDAAGQASPVGPVPEGPFVRVELPRSAESVFAKAVELAVSHELPGSSPSAPSTAFVYRGLCGKLWRVSPSR